MRFKFTNKFVGFFKSLCKILKNIFVSVFKFFAYIFKNIILGIKYLFISVFVILKYIFIKTGLGFKYLFVLINKILSYFFISIFKGFVYIFKGIFKIFKYFFVRVWFGFKYLFLSIYYFLRYIVKSFVLGLKTIGLFFKKIFKNSKNFFKKIGKLLVQIFVIIPGNIIKKIYIAYSDYSDKRKKKKEELMKKRQKHLIEKMAKAERIKQEKQEVLFQKKEKALLIKKAKEEARIKSKQERKSFVEKMKIWYNSLSFVKDIKNRKEMKRQTLLIDFDGSDAVRSEKKIAYRYVAKNLTTGKIEKSMFSAFSKLDVHSYLLSEGYEVYEITPMKRAAKNIISVKIKKSDLVFFLTQLSTFLKSGITLVAAVKILEKQTKKATYRQIYKSVIYELTMGENFSEALAKQGNSFPKLLINMIKTSELTGNLPETLDDMASYYSDTEKTRKQMVSAMTYPLVISVFANIIIVFILIFVIPQFIDIYKDIDAELPGITVAVINISGFLQKNILYILIALGVVVVIYRLLYVNIKVFRTLNQWIFMHMPIIGKIIIYNEVTMFTKTFGSLLNHNVFITDSMEVLSRVTNNEIYKMLIFDTITNLAKGEPISNSFKNNWAFPIIAYEMLLTGEKTGELGDMMIKVSDYYQEQHRIAVNQIKVFIEPVMIVFLALVVGTILLSVILPMFSMYSTVM